MRAGRLFGLALMAAGLLAAGPSSARAQPVQDEEWNLPPSEPPAPEAPPPGWPDRSGFVIGVAGGLGAYESRPILQNVPYGQAGMRLQLEGGLMFNPRFGMLVELEVTGDTEQTNLQVSHDSIGLLGRYFLLRDLWIEGGIGLAAMDLEQMQPDGSTQPLYATQPSGPGFLGGVGADFYRSPGGFELSMAFEAELDRFPLSSVTGEGATTWSVPVALVLSADWY